jgi:hypothetical protein
MQPQELTAPRARQANIFNEAMHRQLKRGIEEDGARTVVMGSTAVAVTDEITATGGGVPLCTSANSPLRVMEGS